MKKPHINNNERLEKMKYICSGCRKEIEGVIHETSKLSENGFSVEICGMLTPDTGSVYNPLG